MRVAVVQLHSEQGSVVENLAPASHLVETAADGGAQLVVLPELFATGAPRRREELWSLAQPPDGSIACWVAEQAQLFGLGVAGTFLEYASALRNQLVLAEPSGRLHRYAKRMLDRIEQRHISPGGGPNVIETSLGRFGVAICLDAAAGSIVEDLRRANVDLVICPHATGATRLIGQLVWWIEHHSHPLLGAFAQAVGSPVLAAGQVGPFHSATRWAGGFMRGSTHVIGSDGLARASVPFPQEGVAFCDLNTK